jgi:hypothetical protein
MMRFGVVVGCAAHIPIPLRREGARVCTPRRVPAVSAAGSPAAIGSQCSPILAGACDDRSGYSLGSPPARGPRPRCPTTTPPIVPRFAYMNQSDRSVGRNGTEAILSGKEGFTFLPEFLPVVGYHINAALMLSLGVSMQHADQGDMHDGYWEMSTDEWTRLTGLKRMAQDNARHVLRETGVWHERLEGYPARRQTRVDLNELIAALCSVKKSDP